MCKTYEVKAEQCSIYEVCKNDSHKQTEKCKKLKNDNFVPTYSGIPLESEDYLIYKLEKECHVTTSIPANEFTKKYYQDEIKRIEDALD